LASAFAAVVLSVSVDDESVVPKAEMKGPEEVGEEFEIEASPDR
jgi:hypothetical protein